MTNGTAPAQGGPRGGAKMTIRVYTVNRYGAVIADRGTVRVLDDQAPLPSVDTATMRETATLLLEPDAAPGVLPRPDAEVDALTRTLCGHLELLIPEVERVAERIGAQSVAGYSALSCVWEARSRLESRPSRRYGGTAGHARRLARVLNLLCDQYENLAGQDR
ncbi:DUF6415 family natural product biosynthesis protein [Streptomyces cinerochromogenes]|uniref:DUF6415 family natural product biosynthesis protein n=1 Tax=Streptomyces cinerochromogenes TaxID=66422 RepID=UPI0036B086B6